MRNRETRATLFIMILATLALSVSAQNSNKKPKPLATPPVITGAEIISQASDIPEPSPSPSEKTVSKPTNTNSSRISDLDERVRRLEVAGNDDHDLQQKRLLMNLDILTRAEQRTESLRKQVFEMIDKENALKTRLEQLEYDIRPEVIERTLQIAGSLRPEEVRENRRKSLASEKANLESLLSQVQTTRASLEISLQKAEQMVEKLRAKAEKEIDDSLNKEDEPARADQQPQPTQQPQQTQQPQK